VVNAGCIRVNAGCSRGQCRLHSWSMPNAETRWMRQPSKGVALHTASENRH